jgi:uncharacterized BrkB/YihY/UPF0761 family membrane protein
VWFQSAEDNVFFLAGGLAFNVLLALLPFVLLLVAGMALLLGAQPEQAARTVVALLQAFLPDDAPSAAELLRDVIEDVQRTKGAGHAVRRHRLRLVLDATLWLAAQCARADLRRLPIAASSAARSSTSAQRS